MAANVFDVAITVPLREAGPQLWRRNAPGLEVWELDASPQRYYTGVPIRYS